MDEKKEVKKPNGIESVWVIQNAIVARYWLNGENRRIRLTAEDLGKVENFVIHEMPSCPTGRCNNG